MKMVGRGDDDEVDGVGTLALGLDHLAVVGVGAGGIDAEALAGFAGTLGRLRKRAGNHLDFSVHFSGNAMDGADERSRPSADHAHAQFSLCSHLVLLRALPLNPER